MGYFRHHAIVVTSWDNKKIALVHECIKTLVTDSLLKVSELTAQTMNGYQSFFIAPDGSNEGWTDSDESEVLRGKVIEHLKSYRYEDGSTSIEWVEVQFGDENGVQKVLSAS
ncbi:MAG TPA: hypothetical protein V6C76_11530 [Drouetiella sp.]